MAKFLYYCTQDIVKLSNTREIPIAFKEWRGLNIRDNSNFIKDGEMSSCVNFDIATGGYLTKRKGFKTLHDGSTLGAAVNVRLLGHFFNGTVSQIIVTTGVKVFRSTDGITWTEVLIAAASIPNAEWGVQYTNNFYIIRRSSTVVQWDGTTATSLAGTPDGTVAAVHKDRLFVVDSQDTATGSRLYYSDIAAFGTFPGSNFIDVSPGDGESIVALAVYQDILFIFKWTKIYGLYIQGTTSDWALRSINPAIGCISKYTVKEVEGFLYFVGARGVYRTDGVNIEDISQPVEPAFRGRLIIIGTLDQDSIAWWEDKLIVQVSVYTPVSTTWAAFSSGQTWGNKESSRWGSSNATIVYLVYHIRIGGWTEWNPAPGFSPFTFVGIQMDAPIRGLYCGNIAGNGKFFRLEDGQYTDDTTEYMCSLVSKTYDFESIGKMKRGKFTIVEFEGDGNASITYPGGSGPFTLTGTGSKQAHKIIGPGYFRNLGFSFELTNSSFVALYSFTLYLHLKRTQIPTPV